MIRLTATRWQVYNGPADFIEIQGVAGLPGLVRLGADLLEVVQQAVDRANTAVSRPEAIKRFRVLPVRFHVGAELTPTGKVRRDCALARHASDIDALYA